MVVWVLGVFNALCDVTVAHNAAGCKTDFWREKWEKKTLQRLKKGEKKKLATLKS